MNTPSTAIRCPSCHGPLVPVALACEACDIRVEGRFAGNEFASLSQEDLHFLRIFVHCEGRIREMESALGVSYPTIKARLAKLKESLATPPSTTAAPTPPTPDPAATILQDLDAGRITFEEAMKQIKQNREGDRT
jgi:hypothetical protein